MGRDSGGGLETRSTGAKAPGLYHYAPLPRKLFAFFTLNASTAVKLSW